MSRTVVLLGANGRLGQLLQPSLTAAGYDVIAVTRHPAPRPHQPGTRPVTADLTEPNARDNLVARLDEWTADSEQVCVIDAVLDRASVDAMRRSVHGATQIIRQLADQFTAVRRPWTLLAASTTAILAPDFYQTPYGRAKRHQALTYARGGATGAAFLLPQLVTPTDFPHPPSSAWSYQHAAHRLTAAATAAPGQPGFVFVAPQFGSGGAEPAAPVELTAALRAHLRSLITARDSMHAHRQAAHGRLRLTPARLRTRLDHHRIPSRLADRFARRHHVTITHDQPSGVRTATPNGADATADQHG